MQTKKLFFFALLFCAFADLQAQVNTSMLWVNEVSYDGMSSFGTTDTGEFVEFVVHNDLLNDPVELAKYKLVLYAVNGFDLSNNTAAGKGLPYNVTSSWYTQAETEHNLADPSMDGSDGFQRCAVPNSDYTTLYKEMPIMMDLPTAMAIIYDNTTVVQLISYEAPFRIKNSPEAGPASDMTTELMTNADGQAVGQSALNMQNHSVQLAGSGGESYDDFDWEDTPTLTATPCAANANQTFAAALPVELVSFTGKAEKTGINLHWKTATEFNNAGFVTERKAEGEREFRDISFTEGAGNSDQPNSYETTDTDVEANTLYSYRLRQTDFDGTTAYSHVIAVKSAGDGSALVLSPNPATESVNLTLRNTGAATLTVTDMSGAVVLRTVTADTDIQSIDISLTDWTKGIYLVRIESDREVLIEKLVVR